MNNIVVDGKEVSLQEFQEMKNNSSIKLVEVSPGIYKTLQKLHG